VGSALLGELLLGLPVLALLLVALDDALDDGEVADDPSPGVVPV
jgi:hypothetical protein